MKYEKLYNVDSKGKTRFWMMEQDGSRHRTISGLVDGKAVESEWTQCHAKNVGKINATTAEEQAAAEIKSLYQKKLDKKYYTEADFAKSETKGYKFTGPMLAVKYEKFPGPCYSQPKLDGVRCVASQEAGLLSRQGKSYHHPHILEALQPVFDAYPGIVLDGELYNHDLKDDFNELVGLIKREKRTPEQDQKTREVVQFHVYDILSHDGTFANRLETLFDIFLDVMPLDLETPIKLVHTHLVEDEQELDKLYVRYMEKGYEGQMVRLNTKYEGNGKRSKGLMKRKEFEDAEFEIVNLIEGQGNWSGACKAVEFRMPDGRLTENGENPKAGIKGTYEFGQELLANPGKYTHVTVRYFTATPAGIPRFGVAVAWHEDINNRG